LDSKAHNAGGPKKTIEKPPGKIGNGAFLVKNPYNKGFSGKG